MASLVEGAGLPVLQEMHYRWFLRELARLWRMRQGRDLAFHLELCIRKWVGLGLEPRTLQFLVCESYERLKGKFEVQSGNDECRTETADAGLTTKSQRHEEETSGSAPIPDPRPLVPSADTTKAPSHEEETAKDAKIAKVPNSVPQIPPQSLTPDPQPLTLESAESVDVRSLETAKDAKSESDSDTRPLDSSNPGPLSSSTPEVLS